MSVKSCVALLLCATLAALCGCAGTGSPWTKQVRVSVVQTTTDGLEQIPVSGAQVTVTQGSALGGSSGGTSSGAAQTLATGADGVALFRVEPGYSYTIAATATGLTSGQVSLDVSHLASPTITREILLTATGS